MARTRERIDATKTPEGRELVLTLEEGYYVLTLAGVPLMSSAAHHSEEHMAEVGCPALKDRPKARVLVGGLGMGYTLRAVLDRISDTGRVVVAELLPKVVEWNRGPLAALAGNPLDDPRVQVDVRDVVKVVFSNPEPFDAILLDTDNGPDNFTAKGNARLYDAAGLKHLLGLLRPGGYLVIWSAYQCPAFVDDLRRAGFEPSVVKAKARGDKGGRHTLYVGQRLESGAPRRRGGPPRRENRKRRR